MSLDDSIEVDVRKTLEGTLFEATSLTKLTGGTANWIFVAKLANPLDDSTPEVLVKHGQGFTASNPNFKLSLHRCRIEAESLRLLAGQSLGGPNQNSATTSGITVRTPALLHLDEGQNSTVQVQEYLPGSIDLKHYLLNHCAEPLTPAVREQISQVGIALAGWLRGFVKWSASQKNEAYERVVSQNGFAQDIKHMLNFAWLSDRVNQFPEILKDVEDVLVEVQNAATKERQDEEGRYQIIHGDFWTGNVVLPDKPLDAEPDIPIFVVDWEIAQFGLPSSDFGQMIAELYALWLYRANEGGLRLMESFIDAYMKDSGLGEEFAFRAALQIGGHLICITTAYGGWGPREKLEEVVRVGRDIIVHAWKRDRAWFNEGKLQGLFTSVAQTS